MLKNTVASIMHLLPIGVRRILKDLYERKPGFGRKFYYPQFGEEAFLQAYFRRKFHMTSQSEMAKSKYLRDENQSGFYVDVSASSPIYGSNTCWFYRQGWRGPNIDTAPGSMKLFQAKRPHDLNLEQLVSDVESDWTFFYWQTPFEVNTLSPEHASFHTRLTGRKPKEIVLRSCRLDSILEEFLPAEKKFSL